MIKLRTAIHIVLLVAMMQAVSAYKFRCWIFCTEQTAIQNDYISHRDACRQYADLRIETDTSSPELMDPRARRSKLVALFSACMADKGWTVPDGKGGQQASAPVPVGTQNPEAAQAASAPAKTAAPAGSGPTIAPLAASSSNAAELAAQRREKAFLMRSSECAFARHGAAYSKVAAIRAKACDIECSERMKASPGSPRPAACPADPNTIGKE